ncbi:Vegetative incompatibility protein HET-E-1 [Cytospora mali]|uniref:Vegetative incompatibility protein HET-E-1 n=1 Tax=Cytospora mali TaxID=578113 RepID=A0A194UR18_CYTMA|nr:Vegetative incompatibility protein HET-E-1 [Valsa mali var. pyri (nom. inval.)]
MSEPLLEKPQGGPRPRRSRIVSPEHMDANLREAGRVTSSASARSLLSRTLTRRAQEPDDGSNDPKGPLGLTTVHDPGPDRVVVADIIFVHGLNGGSQSTWSKSNKPSHFWPKAWLSADNAFREDVRIHSFGYSSGLGRESVLNIRDFAKSLLAAVEDSPVINRDDESTTQEDRCELSRVLGIFDAPEDDLMMHDSVRLPGSCKWLSSKDYYLAWRDSLEPKFLWLSGRPGAGKSVMAGHVVNDLRERGSDCCFFFFQSSDNTKSNPNTFLRSMAWQMAMLHPAMLLKIKELAPEGKDATIDQVDHTPVWRKLYLYGILKVWLDRPQFWIIDSIDESKASADVMNFLVGIQKSWPVSILVTSRDPVKLHLSKTISPTSIRSETISDEDVKEDIALLLKSNMDLLPCPASDRWPTPETMATHILENSGGCFLWASLICSELQKVTSENEIEGVLKSIPSDMDALYTKILQDVSNARFGKDVAKAFITWTTYAFRPLRTSEIQEPIELDISDKIDDVERTIAKCCGNIIYVDTHGKVQLIHATAREFLMTRPFGSEFTATKSEGHRRLAKFLMQRDGGTSRPSRLTSDREARTIRSSPSDVSPRNRRLRPELKMINDHHQQPSIAPPASFSTHPFTRYASKYVFPHLKFIHSDDQEILTLVVKFFASNSVLRWIEFIAAHGNLHAVYKAGKIVNAILARRSRSYPPLSFVQGQTMFQMLEKWGDDLIHIVTKLSRQLRSWPHSIHHIIPSFCPRGSAIRQQFANPSRGGFNVLGLSRTSWDDCLATISYEKSMKPNAVAAAPGLFAVGMMVPGSKIIVYGDSFFEEMHTFMHNEPVWRLAFSDSGNEFASSGVKMVRIWSTVSGNEIANFRIRSPCLALQFSEENILRVVTRQNHLIEWDVLEQKLLHDPYDEWTRDLAERMQLRSPTTVALGSATGLMCVIYRGEDIILWDYLEDRLHDIYEKDTGSVSNVGSHKVAEGSTTVGWVTFSHAIDTNLLAAAYMDGDMVVYDIETGEAISTLQNGNIVFVASSPDGRTLAGADSHGNLTLFEFQTLRPVYRIQFDTKIFPKDLAFTSDSRRIIEIRGNQCRIWEPSVLFHTDAPDDDNGDTASVSISVSTAIQEIGFQATRAPDITAMTCCKASSVVFYALHDSSVFACDIAGEPKSQLLFIVTTRIPVHLVELDESSSILATGDRAGRITARKVLGCNAHHNPLDLQTDEPLVDVMAPGDGLIENILISGRHSRLFVSTRERDALLSIHDGGKGTYIAEAKRDGKSTWLNHPTIPDYLTQKTQAKKAPGLPTYFKYGMAKTLRIHETQ